MLLTTSLNSTCPQPDDPTCHSGTFPGLDAIGLGLLLGVVGVAILGVAVAIGWGQPSPRFRWHALFALLMAPMPTAAATAYLVLYLPSGGVAASLAAVSVVIVWLVVWGRLVGWASNRIPVTTA
jgi:hypothetical protein